MAPDRRQAADSGRGQAGRIAGSTPSIKNTRPCEVESRTEQLELVAGNDPPAMASNRRQGNRHMSPEGYRIGYVYISDDIGGHSIPSRKDSGSARGTVCRKSRLRCNRPFGLRGSLHLPSGDHLCPRVAINRVAVNKEGGLHPPNPCCAMLGEYRSFSMMEEV
jgi:hypothetical protein